MNSKADPIEEQSESLTSDSTATYARICRNHVRFMRVLLKDMKDEDRVRIFDTLHEGYCRSCGRKEISPTDFCQCENDE